MSKKGLKPPDSQAKPEKSIPPPQDDLTSNWQGQVHILVIVESVVMTILPA